MLARKLSLLFFALAVGGVAVSCKSKPPKPGAACTKEGQATCLDDKSRVVCKNGKQVLENCSACTQSKSGGFGSSTETSFFAGCVAGGIGPEGAACDGDSSDCDGKVLVKCMAGQYRRFTCGGPEGCSHGATGLWCDGSIATPGDACRNEGDGACTADGKGLAHCRKGVFVLDKSCHGPAGCTKEGKAEAGKVSLHCDGSVAEVGDLCIDGGTCSTDKHTLLKCVNGKYAVMQRCRGATPECQAKGDSLSCADPGLGELGDPCDGGGACAPDGKALLECKNGALALKHKCRSCKIVGDRADCKF